MASLRSRQSFGDDPSPIAISPKVIQQQTQSRASSKSHLLPLIPQATSSTVGTNTNGGGGVFARHYVVHHLQDETQMDTGN